MSLPRSLPRLRQEAKSLQKQQGLSHTHALEHVARHYGFPNWKAVLKCADETRAVKEPTPPVSKEFIKADDITLDEEDLNVVERTTELAGEVKLKVAENRAHFTSVGIEYAIFEPTITGLKKSILDATRPVRALFESEGFHSYENQGQGEAHRVIKKANFVDADSIAPTTVSLYRPLTKKGDPRMWFKGLGNFAKPSDQVAIVVFEGELYLFNFSKIGLNQLTPGSKAASFIAQYFRAKNSIAEELLEKLREIAKKPIKAIVKGDTAVGMAVEQALNIPPNCSRQPDYEGIELKSGRGRKNRSTLFAQVAKWDISPCKSSAEILDKYGYSRGDDFKLYCTISTQKQNSQGLMFFYDEAADQLIEKDRDGKIVAIWHGQLLRERLLEKHAETFWIHAESITIDGEEYFELHSVTHTRRPLESQLLPLINSGVVTMDHLIKRTGGAKPTTTEKGPLFKINKRDLKFLFPEPKTYSLR